jgi:hypothetical protein
MTGLKWAKGVSGEAGVREQRSTEEERRKSLERWNLII